MPLSRIYQNIPLTINTIIDLDEKASHHLAKVLRAEIGERIILFNGQGGEYQGVIKNIHKRNVSVEVLEFNPKEVESPIDICLAQGIAKGEKMDFIVQKAVELGVKKIIPLITERCNIRLSQEREEKRREHWQYVAISACEQSGRNYIPEIAAPIAFKDWLPTANADKCFVLSPHVENKLTAMQHKMHSVILLIGPEGGLSEAEIDAALKRGFLALNLGPRVLRTETAAIAAISVCQYFCGDLAERVY